MALHKKHLLTILTIAVLIFSAVYGTARTSLGALVEDPVYVPWVWHNIGIYIYDNGTVAPSDAPIEQSGNTYKLTGNLYIGICIERNNTVFDGNGFQISGNYYGTGLLLQNVDSVVAKNLNVQYFGQGVYFDHCNDSTVKQSKLTNCGIEAYLSYGNTISENNVGGEISINYCGNTALKSNSATAISASWSNDNIIQDNHVVNATLETSQLAIQNYTEGIYVDNCANTVLSGNLVERKNIGVDLWQNTNMTLTDNQVTGNQVGFKLWGSDSEHIPQNIDKTNLVNGKPIYYLVNVTNYQVPTDAGWIFALNCKGIKVQNWISQPNWDGLTLINTTDSTIVNCTLSGNYNAIHLGAASNCTIRQNTLSNNNYAAFFLEGAINCSITQNEVVNNYCLFDLWRNSTGNTFLSNDFMGCNQTGPIENGTRNTWDNGTNGNYWSSFTGVDLNHDGVSDFAFLIDPTSGETDRYPLMKPIAGQSPQTLNVDEGFLAMPQEYVNYTLVNVNGVLWAKIDGVYPMHLSVQQVESLPMLYPIPPNTTNIHVYLQGTELNWTDYSTIDPAARHYTDIGDWQMIYCVLTPVPSDFVLKIHYEHPVQIINGSYTFLYDLNISPYLSPSSVISTAHFTIALPAESEGVNVYRTNLTGGPWQPADYLNLTNTQIPTITLDVISQYGKPLLGDIAFVMKSGVVPEFSSWAILVIIVTAAISILFFSKRGRSLPQPKNGL